MSEHDLIGPAGRRGEPARSPPRSFRELDEPVRRYLTHALLSPAASREPGMRLWMTGRIKVRAWLPFRALWEGDGRSLTWHAVVGPGGRPLLRVIDRFAGGAGTTSVRLLGRFPLVDAAGEDVDRSAAGRAAVEAIWAPASLLPERGVRWRAEADDLIVATWDLPPEQPEVRIRIAADGALRSSCVMRWDNGEHGRHGYIPCGGDAHAEKRFGDVVIPSRLTAGWWHGTPRYDPFFEAEIHAAQPVAADSR